MKKIYLLLILTAFYLQVFAQGGQNVITINLVAPQKYNAPMAKLPVITAPLKVSGVVTIKINKYATPDDVAVNRYQIEYFIDDKLIFKTNGKNEADPDHPSFEYRFDTADFSDGKHRLTVNLWDKQGASAIGIEYIVIKNNS